MLESQCINFPLVNLVAFEELGNHPDSEANCK